MTHPPSDSLTRIYRQAQFLMSAERPDQCPQDDLNEVAFAGRSNAGKSSALNALCGQTKLARTSKTPGRTQLINLFGLPHGWGRLVDLPGYGFAKVSRQQVESWQKHLENYLQTRPNLVAVVLLVDIRHELKPFDTQMLDWCTRQNMPVHVLLTKSDKLKQGAAKNTLLKTGRSIRAIAPHASVQLFSALKRTGLEELAAMLDQYLSPASMGEHAVE
ncbi:MAG: YihA family ribosome biogenesis GTP-binding protein [Gammaproteobacteria bacterium]|nr:MAG: YihA family ribosome biogenesis GTP-binding protein [Gammaproteobacteria bacterium]